MRRYCRSVSFSPLSRRERPLPTLLWSSVSYRSMVAYIRYTAPGESPGYHGLRGGKDARGKRRRRAAGGHEERREDHYAERSVLSFCEKTEVFSPLYEKKNRKKRYCSDFGFSGGISSRSCMISQDTSEDGLIRTVFSSRVFVPDM